MNEKLYKEELRNMLKCEYGMSEKGAADALNKFFGLIVKALEEERYVKVKGLGIFKLIDVESRKSVDVNTGMSIEIPEHRKVSYSADASLKELINKPFAHFEAVELKGESPLVEETITQESEEKMRADDALDMSVEHAENPMQNAEGEEIVVKTEVAECTPSNEGVITQQALVEETESVAEQPSEVEESESVVTEPLEAVQRDTEGTSLPIPPNRGIQMKPLNRLEELRRLEREMDREERINRISLLLISLLMFLLVLAGMLFILAPELLEKLFY